MSEMQESQSTENKQDSVAATAKSIQLDGLFAQKLGMTAVYTESGEMIPVTVLKLQPWFVSQIKTQEKDGYSAVQIASGPKRAVLTNKAERGHLKKAGFENGARFVRELRQNLPEGIEVGMKIDYASLGAGDVVKITSTSKGRGFAGSVKRHNFGGGPAAHGSKFHRQPGSSGNRTWPGRVMPGKRFPGHFGNEKVSVRNVKVVAVRQEESVVLVKGPVPGGRHTLVQLMKMKG